VQSSGAQLVVGPYVHPGQSACFWEFELQRSRSMFQHSHYQAVLQLNGRSAATTSPFVTQAAVYAAIPWIIELGLTNRSGLLGRALIGRTTTVELRAQTVLRLPRCPICLPLRPLLRNPVI
jgi:bacteriocin biosynthesis cyclodehydratase domain-containing protein